MSASLSLLQDACDKLPHTERKMFGGHGFFAPNGGMFAGIVTDNRIIFKLADPVTRAALESVGGAAWVYPGKGTPMVMREWILAPDDFYDDADLMREWATRAHKVAKGKVAKGKVAKGKVAKGKVAKGKVAKGKVAKGA